MLSQVDLLVTGSISSFGRTVSHSLAISLVVWTTFVADLGFLFYCLGFFEEAAGL